MSQSQRKFVTYQRSVPKQTRISYQQVATNQKDLNSSYHAQYGIKKQISKNVSELDLRAPKQQYFKNLNQRRKNQGQMSNLKSQLQNLKNQVSKLINKQPNIKTPQKERILLREDRSQKKINYVSRGFQQQFNDKQYDFDDNVSMSSVTTQKVLNQPLRRLQKNASTQNYDQGYLMKLQNDLLKTQIRNLKNKYISKKRELSEKCELLQKKNDFLEISLNKSQQALVQCRKALQMQILLIKKQITQKTQINNYQQVETQKQEIEGNSTMKQKIKKLYEELTQKNKQINNINIQIGDLDAMLQRKKFELKKELQKNLQLSKQLQFSRVQQSRLQQYLQTQMTKRKDLYKQNQILKQKNNQLMNQMYTKQQIVSGSQQYENRLVQQIQQYKKKQDQLLIIISKLRDQNKKIKQINESDKDQINYLKKNYDDALNRIAQLSKKIKQQQENAYQKQDLYRKIIDQNKKKQDQRIKILKQQYQTQSIQINQETVKKVQNQNVEIHQILRQKDRQINKWKAQYKILKLKHQQRTNVQKINKQQMDLYYKGYSQNKHAKDLLQERNKLLQKNVDKYLTIIKQKENQYIRIQRQNSKQNEYLKSEITKLQRNLQSQNAQLQQSKNMLSEILLKLEQQTKYRQDLQCKLAKFIHIQIHGDASDDQEQEKNYNKQTIDHISQSQVILQSRNSFTTLSQIILSQKETIKKTNKFKTQKLKIFQLSQSQKIQLQQISQAMKNLKKRIIQQDQKVSKNVRQLKNKDTQINKLKKQIRQLLQGHQSQLAQLKQRYTNDKIQLKLKTTLQSQRQLKQFCNKQIQLYKQKYSLTLNQNVQMKRKIIELQKQLLNLRQQTKSLSHLYNVKSLQVQQILQKKIQQNNQKQRYIQELQIIKNQRENNLINQINILKDQILSLRSQIRNLNTINKRIQNGSFDQALRNQIQSSKTLREQLSKKNQQLYRIRDNYSHLRSQFDNLRSQVQIQKLKNISQKKNIEIQYQIQIQNLKNKLSVQQKKLSSLQQKISLVIEQNKKKDSFIQSYIMGKKLPAGDKQFITEFIKQYQIQFIGKQMNQKLQADSHQLEKMTIYNYNLLKELAQMKQKMLLYQTMENQNISVYSSKKSDQHSNRDSQIDSPNQGVKRVYTRYIPYTPNSSKFHKRISLMENQNHSNINILDKNQ